MLPCTCLRTAESFISQGALINERSATHGLSLEQLETPTAARVKSFGALLGVSIFVLLACCHCYSSIANGATSCLSNRSKCLLCFKKKWGVIATTRTHTPPHTRYLNRYLFLHPPCESLTSQLTLPNAQFRFHE
jgi:hypothetical protein